jgi:hypothetical protein
MKISARAKTYLKEIDIQKNALRNDWTRRLRNALFALASMDPAWMIWVEKHVPAQCDAQSAARLVELQARTLLVRRYSDFGKGTIKAIIEGDRPFSDDGDLTM